MVHRFSVAAGLVPDRVGAYLRIMEGVRLQAGKVAGMQH